MARPRNPALVTICVSCGELHRDEYNEPRKCCPDKRVTWINSDDGKLRVQQNVEERRLTV